MVSITLWPIESQQNYQSLDLLKYLNVIKAVPLLGIYIDQKEFP